MKIHEKGRKNKIKKKARGEKKALQSQVQPISIFQEIAQDFWYWKIAPI